MPNGSYSHTNCMSCLFTAFPYEAHPVFLYAVIYISGKLFYLAPSQQDLSAATLVLTLVL